MKKWIKLTFAAILIMGMATVQVAFAVDIPIVRKSRTLLEEEDKKSVNSRVIRREFFENAHAAYNITLKIEIVRVHALAEKEVNGTRMFFIERVEFLKDVEAIIVNGNFILVNGIFIRAMDCNSTEANMHFDQLYEWLCTKNAGWFNMHLDKLYLFTHGMLPKSYIYNN